jgi:hypothetical protein
MPDTVRRLGERARPEFEDRIRVLVRWGRCSLQTTVRRLGSLAIFAYQRQAKDAPAAPFGAEQARNRLIQDGSRRASRYTAVRTHYAIRDQATFLLSSVEAL